MRTAASRRISRVVGMMAVMGGLCLGAASHTFAATEQVFTLANKTGQDIEEVHLSWHDADHWGGDLLGKDNVLKNGDNADLTFRGADDDAKRYDFKIVFANDKSFVWKNYALAKITKLTIYFNEDGEPRARYELKAADQQVFSLANKTGQDIKEVYVSAHGADDWGDDMLGKDELVNGNEVAITFNPKHDVAAYDIKIVFDNDKALQWNNCDLTKINKMTIYFNEEGKPKARYE